MGSCPFRFVSSVFRVPYSLYRCYHPSRSRIPKSFPPDTCDACEALESVPQNKIQPPSSNRFPLSRHYKQKIGIAHFLAGLKQNTIIILLFHILFLSVRPQTMLSLLLLTVNVAIDLENYYIVPKTKLITGDPQVSLNLK